MLLKPIPRLLLKYNTCRCAPPVVPWRLPPLRSTRKTVAPEAALYWAVTVVCLLGVPKKLETRIKLHQCLQSGWEGETWTNGKPAMIYQATNRVAYVITYVINYCSHQLVLLTTTKFQWFILQIDFYGIQLELGSQSSQRREPNKQFVLSTAVRQHPVGCVSTTLP